MQLTRDGELFLGCAERIIAEYDAFSEALVADRRNQAPVDDPISVYVSSYGAQTAWCTPATWNSWPPTPPTMRAPSTNSC